MSPIWSEGGQTELPADNTTASDGKSRLVIGCSTASVAANAAPLFHSPEADSRPLTLSVDRADPQPSAQPDWAMISPEGEALVYKGAAQQTAERWRLVHHGSVYGPIRLDTGHEITIGRSHSTTLRIDHPQVSGIHAVIRLREGRVSVKDLSTNGTFVDGLELGRNQVVEDVAHGSVISLVLATVAERTTGGIDNMLPFVTLERMPPPRLAASNARGGVPWSESAGMHTGDVRGVVVGQSPLARPAADADVPLSIAAPSPNADRAPPPSIALASAAVATAAPASAATATAAFAPAAATPAIAAALSAAPVAPAASAASAAVEATTAVEADFAQHIAQHQAGSPRPGKRKLLPSLAREMLPAVPLPTSPAQFVTPPDGEYGPSPRDLRSSNMRSRLRDWSEPSTTEEAEPFPLQRNLQRSLQRRPAAVAEARAAEAGGAGTVCLRHDGRDDAESRGGGSDSGRVAQLLENGAQRLRWGGGSADLSGGGEADHWLGGGGSGGGGPPATKQFRGTGRRAATGATAPSSPHEPSTQPSFTAAPASLALATELPPPSPPPPPQPAISVAELDASFEWDTEVAPAPRSNGAEAEAAPAPHSTFALPRRCRRVSWASDERLCDVRLFEAQSSDTDEEYEEWSARFRRERQTRAGARSSRKGHGGPLRAAEPCHGPMMVCGADDLRCLEGMDDEVGSPLEAVKALTPAAVHAVERTSHFTPPSVASISAHHAASLGSAVPSLSPPLTKPCPAALKLERARGASRLRAASASMSAAGKREPQSGGVTSSRGHLLYRRGINKLQGR